MKNNHTYIIKYEFRKTSNKCLFFFYTHGIGVFLDFSKAFDTIDHNILLYKLSHYGIRGRALEWFRDYLSHRKQFNGHDSQSKLISCGVPQGSLLGPTFVYLIY